MSIQNGFIESIKKEQPSLWEVLKKTANNGLVIIDEQNDAVTATNRLLWTYPDLHLTISSLINSWNEKDLEKNSEANFKELIENIKGKNK